MIFLYQTTLKVVYEGMAKGANGEILRLIGPFAVKEGSRVWTDGNIIFGFVRPRGANMIFPTAGGIPILCDDRKGYFTKKGVWKNYPVAEHDFITNNKNNFFGGNNTNQQGEKIFDAVINDDGEVFSVRWNDNFRYYPIGYAPPYVPPIKIYKNGELFESVEIKNFGEELFTKCDEMFKSVGGNDYTAYKIFYILEIQSFSIDKDGNFDFFVFGSGTCEGKIIAYNGKFYDYYYPLNMYTALYHVQNESVTKIASHVYGSRIDHTFDGEYIFRQQTGDGSFVMNKFGQISFYDSDGNIFAENLPIDENFFHIKINSFSEFIYSTAGIRREAKAEYTIYTPDGKTTTGISEKYSTSNYIKEGFFSKNADGSLKRFDFKPIIKKLSDGKYLFGNHGGKLYLKTGDNIQEVGDNLKNFRLEELKNMKKAKESEN